MIVTLNPPMLHSRVPRIALMGTFAKAARTCKGSCVPESPSSVDSDGQITKYNPAPLFLKQNAGLGRFNSLGFVHAFSAL